MSISVQPLPGTIADPLYPDSDGEPVGETECHFLALRHIYGALSHRYRRHDVHVAGKMLLYYEKGNPSAVCGPDVMVSKGVRGKHFRQSFRIWEEGVVPAVIIEITSVETGAEDEGPKPLIYASIGVKEYFMFDSQGDYLHPRLQGFRLAEGKYAALASDTTGRLFSRELGLFLAADDHLVRLVALPRALKPTQKRAVDAARSEAEIQRRRAAELEAELTKLRAKLPPGTSE